MREFEDGSERLETYLQALAAKLKPNEEFSPDDTFTMETTFIRTPDTDTVTENDTNPAPPLFAVSQKSHLSPSKTKMSYVVPEPL